MSEHVQVSQRSLKDKTFNWCVVQQENPSIAETGVYVDKIRIFDATSADRVLYAKGHEIILYIFGWSGANLYHITLFGHSKGALNVSAAFTGLLDSLHITNIAVC
jgi:hypothetical protein